MDIQSIFNKYSNYTIGVLGDIMLDKYIFGNVKRISPEAPVPIVNVLNSKCFLGGAGNVMRNIISLGGNVNAFAILGEDEIGNLIFEELIKNKISTSNIIRNQNIISICKQRILSNNQQLLRIDYEDIKPIENKILSKLFEKIKENILSKKIDTLVLEDYGKGLFTKIFTQKIIDFANKHNIITIYDPNKRNPILIKNLTIMKPNRDEAFSLAKIEDNKNIDLLDKVAKKLLKKYNPKFLLISLADKGIALYTNNYKKIFPTKAKEVYDVSGAGDTVIATISLSYLANKNIEEAIILANYAASIVVGKVGTATATQEEILKLIKD